MPRNYLDITTKIFGIFCADLWYNLPVAVKQNQISPKCRINKH